jgi:hypothetical protein
MAAVSAVLTPYFQDVPDELDHEEGDELGGDYC